MSAYSALILATAGLTNYFRLGEAAPPFADSQGVLSLAATGGAGSQSASLLTSDPAAHSWTPANGVYRSAGNFTFNAGAFSLECWTDPTAVLGANNNACCGAWVGTGSMFYFGGGSLLSFYSGGTALTVAVVGGTQHWVGTYDGTNRRIYVNGILVAGPTAGLAPGAGTVPFQYSGYANTNGFYWNVPAQEIAVYNVAISAATVLAHYNAGIAAAGFPHSQSIIIG